jgi:hypothetical protein
MHARTGGKTKTTGFTDGFVLQIAGAAGIELALTVLETAVLPLNYAPSVSQRKSFAH